MKTLITKDSKGKIRVGKKSGVSKAANGEDKQAFGYIWIYKNDFSEELLKSKLEKVKDCPIYKKYIKNLTNV